MSYLIPQSMPTPLTAIEDRKDAMNRCQDERLIIVETVIFYRVSYLNHSAQR
ncbi:hypothetical protein [Nostoc sp. DSM 114159]